MSKDLIPAERIEKKIILLRGQKVMLDRDLAELYEVRTSILKRAVTRNGDRFPDDFMFVLDNQELATLRCQFGTSKTDPRGGTRYTPMAFTEQGVAMLSSVLNSPRAVQVDELEKKYDAQFRVVFDAMRELMNPPEPPSKPIGFGVHERQVNYRVATKKNTAKNRGGVVPAPDEVTGCATAKVKTG